MKLVFLGTSAALPTTKRGLSCLCLERYGRILMFDAGEGAQTAYLKARLGWNREMKIFVTHLHGDHCVGILGLLQTMSMRGRTKPLEIYGPGGLEEFIYGSVRALGFGLTFPVLISAVREGRVYDSAEYSVSACRASHSVTAFSYLFAEKDRPGRFDKRKAEELGVPEGRDWKRLQTGNSVIVGGKTVSPDQVLGEKRPGKRIGISGDTAPSDKLEEFFGGCDYLVFDSTFVEEHKANAAETGHSTAGQAATLAKNAGVKNLILTHFSMRYPDEDVFLREAGRIHHSVMAARDMLQVEVA